MIGATANARRVAAVHVIFNLLTGGVAVLLLPALLWIVRSTGSFLGLEDIPAVSLALFHTVFNFLGLLLMWPLTDRLADLLNARFATEAERLSRPKYLDRNVMATPVLAMEALNLELRRLAKMIRSLVSEVVSIEGLPDGSLVEQEQGLRALLDAIEQFVIALEIERLPGDQRGKLAIALRFTGYLDEVISLVKSLDDHRHDVMVISRPPVDEAVASYQSVVVAQNERCEEAFAAGVSGFDEGYEDVRRKWHELKSILLDAAASRAIPMIPLSSALEGPRGYFRIAEQLTKTSERQYALNVATDDDDVQAVA